MLTLDVPANRLSVAVIEKYLELKGSGECCDAMGGLQVRTSRWSIATVKVPCGTLNVERQIKDKSAVGTAGAKAHFWRPSALSAPLWFKKARRAECCVSKVRRFQV
ncbi:MAG: hypothetical protein KatS3mg058_2958 [Roseiflexus sp.]|nr:MAG: hypothetical protein KatS3mg058_2958 [Roseiflexus sp.]